jgi:hypothetical protein
VDGAYCRRFGTGRYLYGQAEPNLPARDETYYPVFDIPLTEFFALKDLCPAGRDFYFQLGSGGEKRRVKITAPEGFNDSGAYILLTNASKSGGIQGALAQSSP